MSRAFSSTEISKLKHVIQEGISVTTDINALKEGLKETVSAVAEEMDLKPAVLNKAISIAYKNEFAKVQEGFNEVENILAATGRDN